MNTYTGEPLNSDEDVIAEIKPQVDFNCNLSDAHFWGMYSICELLLRLRHRYIWEEGIKPWEKVDYTSLGEFVEEKENLWEDLKDEEIKEIEIQGKKFSPFEAREINRFLLPLGYCYGAGYALGMKPSFFLAELESREERGEYNVYWLGREISRDLYTAPAMLLGREVFLRLETTREFLWEKMEEADTGRRRKFLEEFMRDYGLLELEARELWEDLREVAREELGIFLYHETAEAEVSNQDIEELLRKYAGTPAEIALRAITNLLADFNPGGMVDYIIAQRRKGSLALYFMNLSGMRRLMLEDFVDVFMERGWAWEELSRAREKERERLQEGMEKLLEILREGEGYSSVSSELSRKVFDPLGINL